MRIDKFLKNSRLIKRRPVAKEACDGGRISINGKVVKAGSGVSVGDEVSIRFGDSTLSVEVLSIPKTVRKDDAESMYVVLEKRDI